MGNTRLRQRRNCKGNLYLRQRKENYRFTCIHQEDPENSIGSFRNSNKKSKTGKPNMTKISNLHKKWIKNPEYKKAYDESRVEFEVAQEIIEARMKSGLSQGELASLMSTSQSAIARLESGAGLPSLRTLTKLAAATNTHIEIHFKPIKNSKQKLAA